MAPFVEALHKMLRLKIVDDDLGGLEVTALGSM